MGGPDSDKQAEDKSKERRENPIQIGGVHCRVGSGWITFEATDAGFGPTIKIETGAFGNINHTMSAYVDRPTLEKLAELFQTASEFDDYTPEYCHAAKNDGAGIKQETDAKPASSPVTTSKKPTSDKVFPDVRVAQDQSDKRKQKLILRNHQAVGDILMLTATVRDLHASHPGRYITDVRTPFPELWENNPYITPVQDDDPEAKSIRMHYPIINECNEGAYHFIHGFSLYLGNKLGIKIKTHKFWGDIHLSDEEKSWVSMIQEHFTGEDTPFWLICSGGKTDYSAKWWVPEFAQEVVDHFRDKIQFVQFGVDEPGHVHPTLKGVINLIGETDLRMFMRLLYHADGVLCPITFAMHMAAASESKPGKPKRKACVVTAGGREPSNFTAYTNHQFIHANGMLMCCDNGGCWKSRTDKIGDGDRKDKELCTNTIDYNGRKIQACIYHCVKPKHVIAAIEKYYDGGALQYIDGNTIEATWDDRITK